MKTGHWVALAVALLVGVIIGFGAGFNPSKAREMEQKIEQLAKENADLRGRLTASPAGPAGQK